MHIQELHADRRQLSDVPNQHLFFSVMVERTGTCSIHTNPILMLLRIYNSSKFVIIVFNWFTSFTSLNVLPFQWIFLLDNLILAFNKS